MCIWYTKDTDDSDFLAQYMCKRRALIFFPQNFCQETDEEHTKSIEIMCIHGALTWQSFWLNIVCVHGALTFQNFCQEADEEHTKSILEAAFLKSPLYTDCL